MVFLDLHCLYGIEGQDCAWVALAPLVVDTQHADFEGDGACAFGLLGLGGGRVFCGYLFGDLFVEVDAVGEFGGGRSSRGEGGSGSGGWVCYS